LSLLISSLLHLTEKVNRERQSRDGADDAENLYDKEQAGFSSPAAAVGTPTDVIWKNPVTFFAAYEFQKSRTVLASAIRVKLRRSQC